MGEHYQITSSQPPDGCECSHLTKTDKTERTAWAYSVYSVRIQIFKMLNFKFCTWNFKFKFKFPPGRHLWLYALDTSKNQKLGQDVTAKCHLNIIDISKRMHAFTLEIALQPLMHGKLNVCYSDVWLKINDNCERSSALKFCFSHIPVSNNKRPRDHDTPLAPNTIEQTALLHWYAAESLCRGYDGLATRRAVLTYTLSNRNKRF